MTSRHHETSLVSRWSLGDVVFTPLKHAQFFSRSDDNMRTALDALAAEHGVGVRLPRAASRSGLSMWLVSRRVDALSHSFKLANVHNNMHLFLHTLISNQSAA